MTTYTLMCLPPDAPAAQGQPNLWRATLAVDGEKNDDGERVTEVIAEVVGGRELCLAAIGIQPLPEPRGVWLARGEIPVFMFSKPTERK